MVEQKYAARFSIAMIYTNLYFDVLPIDMKERERFWMELKADGTKIIADLKFGKKGNGYRCPSFQKKTGTYNLSWTHEEMYKWKMTKLNLSKYTFQKLKTIWMIKEGLTFIGDLSHLEKPPQALVEFYQSQQDFLKLQEVITWANGFRAGKKNVHFGIDASGNIKLT